MILIITPPFFKNIAKKNTIMRITIIFNEYFTIKLSYKKNIKHIKHSIALFINKHPHNNSLNIYYSIIVFLEKFIPYEPRKYNHESCKN